MFKLSWGLTIVDFVRRQALVRGLGLVFSWLPVESGAKRAEQSSDVKVHGMTPQ